MAEIDELSEGAQSASGLLQPNSPSLHELVGAVTVQGAMVEMTLMFIFQKLATSDAKSARVSQLLSNGQDFSWLVEHCKKLAGALHTDAAWREELTVTLADTRYAMAERNRVVHSTWLSTHEGETVGAKPRRGQDIDFYPVSAEDLRAWHQGLVDVWVRLVDCLGKIQLPEIADEDDE
ncbi:hypothetical protein acdb102_22280 [Acidothermaceae bacterium B102]|nr:hypothetical protein acdb102_22280 [Acidothermaceae bacterium B102]